MSNMRFIERNQRPNDCHRSIFTKLLSFEFIKKLKTKFHHLPLGVANDLTRIYVQMIVQSEGR